METFPFIQEKYLQVSQALSLPHTTRAGWTCAKSCRALPNLPRRHSAGQRGERLPLPPRCN